MPGVVETAIAKEELTARAYRGIGSVLLSFDIDESVKARLAGFAIRCKPPKGKAYSLLNRLNFKDPVMTSTTREERRWTESDKAPFQKFRWAHYPGERQSGTYNYTITAMFFGQSKAFPLKPGPSVEIPLVLLPDSFEKFELGFTRGYVSSQAYVEKFKNGALRPSKGGPVLFDSSKFEKKWEWLGYEGRKLLYDFLGDCKGGQVTVDAFVYDLDEPDFIRALAALGSKARVYLDDSANHQKGGASELKAKKELVQAGVRLKTGHFGRYAHNKVLIKRKNGKPVRVLAGSANFSIRGYYVQSNNVMVFDEPEIAKLYAKAFELAFDDETSAAEFRQSPLAKKWHDFSLPGTPQCGISFAPHTSGSVSLKRVSDEIAKADSSVLFAIMGVDGSGDVLDKLRKAAKADVYTYGVVQSMKGIGAPGPGHVGGGIVPFSFLEKQAPKPFRDEIRGGAGQIIHHKFIVADFNDSEPVVFAGSSNLAKGGEENNGDNLVAIFDPEVAAAYAVEAIRLIDHYRFRTVMKKATKRDPLILKGPEDQWWKRFYNPKSISYTERRLFVR